MLKLAILVGSLRKESINKKLAMNLVELGKDKFDATILPLDDVPMFNQDLENNLPAPVVRLKESIKAADAALLVTPEYNRGIPPLMKNAVDWASRPYGAGVWLGKPTACCGISPSPVGTAVAQSQLRSTLAIVGARLICFPEVYLVETPDFFDAAGKITAERTRTYLRDFMGCLADWTLKLR